MYTTATARHSGHTPFFSLHYNTYRAISRVACTRNKRTELKSRRHDSRTELETILHFLYSDVEGIPNILSQQDTRSCTSAYSGECGREHAVENTLKKKSQQLKFVSGVTKSPGKHRYTGSC